MTIESVQVEFRDLPDNYTEEQRAYLEQFLLRLPPLKPEQCTISPFKSMISEDGALFVKIIIRNGSQNIIKIKEMPIAVRDGQMRNIAVGVFKTEDMELQPYSAYLRTFVFRPEDILVENPEMNRWTVYPQQIPLNKKSDANKLN